MSQNFFLPRPTSRPPSCAYSDANPQYKGLLKMGYANPRVRQWLNRKRVSEVGDD